MAFAASTACCKPSPLLAPRASSLRAQAVLCRPSSTATTPRGLRAAAPASAFAQTPAPRRRAASTGIVCGKVTKGSVPPNFTLKDQDGKTVSLSKYKGKPVVLYFYPADETPGCTKQACAFRDSYEKYKKAGAEVIGISGDDAASHKAFAKKYKLPFTLLSDEGNKVRKEWGVPSDLFGTLPGRQTYVLDKKGVVQYVYNNQFQPEKHIGETLKIIQNL
ncbi:peroxiredoxin Q, chloroplastic isoform X2 [Brachypodium distachyon]|uniref:peroxiredoxin Q, chloroplastic isoform X2 n=1 Tax=Brachypodium distachyon TaxID=15368 RepID=UPI0001C76005|nr:peroxiredoxin Q, chloroplastic isoform X2 [Brachypodium distachyon]|eukprot:XP_003564150.1 peroxiredoxin Q, chloroplastic isoform X2 [Brachypodium distachyon]